jgi:hypothetical protein
LIPTTFKGESHLISGHIFDPGNRLNIIYDPATRLARESILSRPPTPPPNSVPGRQTLQSPA